MSDKTLLPGMQCIVKTDHTKPKPQELKLHKGDLVTIISVCQEKGWYHACHNDSGAEGLLCASSVRIRPAIKVDTRLSLMPWFHGAISGIQAVQQLQPRENGLFLVRESTSHPGDYVLCVCFSGQITHYRISYQDGKLSIDLTQNFSNLIDMIEATPPCKARHDNLCGARQMLHGAKWSGVRNLTELLTHHELPDTNYYTIHQGVLCTKLLKPKTKHGTISAEEKLSKAGWLLNFQHLTLCMKIGEGEFGDVMQGEYFGRPVAIKIIKCDVTAQNFLAETATMTKFQHRNLVNLMGVILNNGLYLVMELMSKGNLVNYLRSRGRSMIAPQQLLKFALDVVQGMEYLENKRLVHRDLAARNILVSESEEAKISDFGLSKTQLQPEDLSRLPVKWSAPEALHQNKFSSRSDVWSFGVLLWEVYSYGRSPYPKMSVKDVVVAVQDGYRMESPDNCPPVVYSMMRSCWELEPGKRPTFRKLREKLEKLLLGD